MSNGIHCTDAMQFTELLVACVMAAGSGVVSAQSYTLKTQSNIVLVPTMAQTSWPYSEK